MEPEEIPIRILMVGLEVSGKTKILYKMKLDENVVTIPTVGFNVENIEYKKCKFYIWDLGGGEISRTHWRFYYPNTKAIIWVVDSSDAESLEISKEELMKLLVEEPLKNASLLVFANKQDLKAMKVSELTEKLGLISLNSRNWNWYIQASCALTGDGLYEGLDWLASNTSNKNQTICED